MCLAAASTLSWKFLTAMAATWPVKRRLCSSRCRVVRQCRDRSPHSIRPISASMASRLWSITWRRCATFHGFSIRAASWFTQVGTEKCPGTMMFSLSGSVNRPGVYEMPMGVTIRDLIEQCGGGVPNGRKIKAVFPGGPAFPMVTADQLDLPDGFRFVEKGRHGVRIGRVSLSSTMRPAWWPRRCTFQIFSRTRVAANVLPVGWER